MMTIIMMKIIMILISIAMLTVASGVDGGSTRVVAIAGGTKMAK